MRWTERDDRTRTASLALAVLLLAAAPSLAASRSYPVDCLPDRLIDETAPASAFGAPVLPGIVLGPPGASSPTDGSTSVASLGFAGAIAVGWDDVVIEDRPGPDLVVFENAFFRHPVPDSADDDFRVFAEPGFVEVSADGVTWHRFSHDAGALAEASGVADVGRDLWLRLRGLAGVTPTFSGSWTLPDDPLVFDPTGSGGVSGAGGDAFDLADVGLATARFVRVVDANTQNGFPGSAQGFDLDAVVALHARPLASTASDLDGDGLGDEEEIALHGSDPHDPDTDGDGIDDGREIAGCRDPGSSATAPRVPDTPRLWVQGAACTELRWTFLGTGRTYDLLRGVLGSWSPGATTVELGATSCLVSGSTSLRWSCDAERPGTGTGFFYLARDATEADWGRSGSLLPRSAAGTCP